jgi:hypothetical protein
MNIELDRLRIAYEMAKVQKRKANGKAYTDREVARDYLTQNSSMISKVLSGSAKSERVVESLVNFINSVDPKLLK